MKQRLKIGIVVDQLLAGGVQLAAIEQVKQLNKLGYETKLLILMRKKYPINFSYLVQDLPHQYVSDSYPSFFRKTFKLPIFHFLSTLHLTSPFLATKTIKAKDYDILVSWGTTTCLTTQAIFKKQKIPYIAIIHDPIVYILEKVYSKTSLSTFFPILKPLAKHFEATFVRDALETIIISNVHFNYLKNNYNRKAKILHLGVHSPKKTPKKRGDAILSFGRWEKEKNPAFLLKLLKQLPKTKLIIAGSWTNQEDLSWFKKSIVAKNLSSRVEIIPHYSKYKLQKICSRARLFIHPHFEAFGLAALEAASHGLPIIMPKKSGVTEKFKHGVHGFFPDSINLQEYKKYTQKLLKNQRFAIKMGKASAKVVKSEFNWKSNVNTLLQIINSAMNVKEKQEIAVIETGHSLGTSLGGGDLFLEPIATKLASHYHFTIITTKIGKKHWNKTPLIKALDVLPNNPFDNKGNPMPVFLTYCIRMWQTFFRLKQKTNPHLILYSSTNVLPDILPAFLIKRQKPEFAWIAVFHHLIPPPHKREGRLIVNIVSFIMQHLALSMARSQAEMIISMNENLKQELIKKGFAKEKVRVVEPGIDFEDITRTKSEKKLVFDAIYVGRIHESKGLFDIVPIWKQVTKIFPLAKVALIGDGPTNLKQKLIRKIEKETLSENIKLLGYIPHPEVFKIIKSAKVFLFLDHEAGFALAVAEAMACGIPVIGYKLTIFEEIYQQGFIVVPKYNLDAYAKQVILLLSNTQKRKKLSAQAVKQAQKFSWETTINTFHNCLQEIEENPAPRENPANSEVSPA